MAQCYVFAGPEIGEKSAEVERIRRGLREKYGAALEESVFYALEDAPASIASLILTGSLFAASRFFVIKNAEAVKKKEDVGNFESLITNLDKNTTLVLLTDENGIDKTLEKVKGVEKKIFWEMFDDRKREWIFSFFSREGLKITGEAVDVILEMVENNTAALKSACSSLALFCTKEKPVSGAEVERLLAHTRSESAFTLFSAIAHGELERSLDILGALLDAKESAASIFPGLLWCWRKLRDYQSLAAAGNASNEFELRKAGLSSQKVRADYTAAARRYNPSAVNRRVALAAEIDMCIRSTGAALERILLERYVYEAVRVE